MCSSFTDLRPAALFIAIESTWQMHCTSHRHGKKHYLNSWPENCCIFHAEITEIFLYTSGITVTFINPRIPASVIDTKKHSIHRCKHHSIVQRYKKYHIHPWTGSPHRKLSGCFIITEFCTLIENSLAHRTSHRHKKHCTIRRYTNHHLHHRHKERPPIHIRIMVLYT